ncbi:uncharacterized protein LOC117103704 [Anneissia japonica]|uniref:uncharacterized protein LOC117103704 n=1 Tax=Anneissia japonica TaxID=1529436 RepID=UPI001425B247|nr:uncharacterized protein LOC117103704 [Anneissia japonica]
MSSDRPTTTSSLVVGYDGTQPTKTMGLVVAPSFPKLQRLLTLLASHKEDVQKVIVVLVAEYVHQLQKGTLHPAVKKSLGNGLNSIVSICDDKSLSLLGGHSA